MLEIYYRLQNPDLKQLFISKIWLLNQQQDLFSSIHFTVIKHYYNFFHKSVWLSVVLHVAAKTFSAVGFHLQRIGWDSAIVSTWCVKFEVYWTVHDNQIEKCILIVNRHCNPLQMHLYWERECYHHICY